MLNRKKPMQLIFLFVLIFLIVLAGCTKSGNEPGVEKEVDPNTSNENSTNNENNTDTNDIDSNFNPEGLPVVNEKITLTASGTKSGVVRKEFNEMHTFKELEKDTNIEVEWDLVPPSGWLERRNLIFASGDLPDVVLNLGNAGGADDGEIVRYGTQGLLIPLNDLIEKYAPNIQKLFEIRPEYKQTLTAPDGNIYTLPRIAEKEEEILQDILFINKNWLDQLDMDIPKTTAEFKEVLKAFKENDLNGSGRTDDQIPFTFLFDDHPAYGLYSMHGAFGLLDYEDHMLVQNGDVIFTADKPEYKEAVKYFHSLYAEELIDPESFTMTLSDIRGMAGSGTSIIGAFSGYSPNATQFKIDQLEEFVGVPPLKGPEGHQKLGGHNPAYFAKGGFSITSANKHPEATIRWIDQVYEPVRSFDFANGPVGIVWDLQDDGNYLKNPSPEGMTSAEWRHFEAPANNFPYIRLADMTNKMKSSNPVVGFNRTEYLDEFKEYISVEYYPNILFPQEDLRKLAQFNTDIQQYVNKMRAQWITSGGIDEEWNDYLEQLERLQLDEMIEIYQRNYDNVN